MSRLIVGIGNPGKEYSQTRHNLGFLVIEKIAEQNKFKFGKESGVEGVTARARIGDCESWFLKPSTYVNNSGIAIRQMCQKYKITTDHLLVVCDDLSLPFGRMRLRTQGSSGGHNGLRSVIHELGTDAFARLRLGISSPETKDTTVDYVLAGFSAEEKKGLKGFVEEAAECCRTWAADQVKKAMDQYNQRKE